MADQQRLHRSGTFRPTVAIIVRTIGSRHLTRAIASLRSQTYTDLSIVVVIANPEFEPDAALFDASVRVVPTTAWLPRPLAANRGLDAASSDYIGFLDEDDWLAPEHVATLTAALAASPGYALAYADTVIASEPPAVMSRGYWKQRFQDFPVFTINAALFAHDLVRAGCRFDPALDLVEDWDFWLQCAQLTDFLHVRSATAFYDPASGTSGTGRAANFDPSRSAPDKERLQDKWLGRYRALEAASRDALRRADMLIEGGDLASASPMLLNALAADPGSPLLLSRLALCLHRLGEPGTAISALRRACDVDRASLDLRLQLALLEHAGGERTAAAQTLQSARSLAKSDEAQARVASTMRALSAD